MTRSRKSRFESAEARRSLVSDDDRMTPGARTARQMQLVHFLDSLPPTPGQNGSTRPMGKPFDLVTGENVRTDAVEVVVQTSADGWRARWVLAEHDGQRLVRSLHIEPDGRATPPGGVTSNLLRELSPSRALAEASSHYLNIFHHQLTAAARHEASELGPPPSPRKAVGRPRVTDERLRAVALAYLEELKAGPGVHQRLAKRFGDSEWQTMRDQVAAARRRGWLSPATQPGRKGGTPGPRLLEYLAKSETADTDE